MTTSTTMKVSFSKEAQKEFKEILRRYPDKRAALLPTLHLAQREFGWLSTDVMEYVG
ncbi:MAG: NAD(P)H-dependent oxidoreductase subunit E, partial [Calditrichaeota bacterium]